LNNFNIFVLLTWKKFKMNNNFFFNWLLVILLLGVTCCSANPNRKVRVKSVGAGMDIPVDTLSPADNWYARADSSTSAFIRNYRNEEERYLRASETNTWPEWSGNPVFNGWYADPEAIIYGDRYWIYPTFSAEYEKQVQFDCFSSPDLVHWTKHENILDTAAVKWARRAMWAPGVTEKDGKYYLFFGANDVHEGEVGGIGVALANRPEGPYRDLTGKPLISQIINGAQPIDQFVFRDTDGSYYLIYGGWRHCNVVRLNGSFTGLEPLPGGDLFREITPEGYVEGPVMFRRNGKYYFMWSEGGWTGPNYKVAYAISDSLFGPWKRIGTVLQQNPDVATGAGHHSVLNIPGTDEWYIVYHRRPLSETSPHHRVTCIDRMVFDDKGYILPVKITFEGVTSRPINR
jgi:beta-xylosidase